MSRALVLSGGGLIGIAWQTGLIVGLARQGVRLSQADLIVGTSAGSAVGAQLALGRDLEAQIAALDGATGAPVQDPDAVAKGMLGFLTISVEGAKEGLSDEELGARLGAFALQSSTPPEDALVSGQFADLAGEQWPSHYRCTAVDAQTGVQRVWDAKSGAPLERGVASSCAVPGVFPPITINGRRYIDGGIISGTNIPAAAGHERVLVLSLVDWAAKVPGMEFFAQRTVAEAASAVEAGAQLVTIGPDAQAAEAMGTNPMDPAAAPAAAAAGVAQGIREASRLAQFWS